MTFINNLFLGSISVTGVALLGTTLLKPDTQVDGITATIPTPSPTNTPSPSPTPQPAQTPLQQPLAQGTVETVSPQPTKPVEPSEVPVERDNWVAKKLGKSPEQIESEYQTQQAYQPVYQQPYQPTYQPVYRPEYQTNQVDYAPARKPTHRGSGRVRQQPVYASSMRQEGEPWNEYLYRSGVDPVWSFGDNENWYPSAYELPDQTTTQGSYKCNFGVCMLGYHWSPDPGSTPIDNPDPTRNARRIKAGARFANSLTKPLFNP